MASKFILRFAGPNAQEGNLTPPRVQSWISLRDTEDESPPYEV
jgi:hypothetical protein